MRNPDGLFKNTGGDSLMRTITCCLISAVEKVCIDAIPLPGKTNEMGYYGTALRKLVSVYGKKFFRLVSYDAGATSLENARATLDLGLHYLFGLKNNQKTLLQEAERLLGRKKEPVDHWEDSVGSKTVIRRCFITEVMAGYLDWDSLKTVVRIDSITIDNKTGEISKEMTRYFISSLSANSLTPRQWQIVIRAHWSVENQCHNTFDRLFHEDTKPWIKADSIGMLNVLLLRRLAYNLQVLFRASLRCEENRFMPWRKLKGIFDWVFTILPTAEVHFVTS